MWGATLVILKGTFNYDISIHAPMWGATPADAGLFFVAFLFQSTHPCGVRQQI